MAVKVDDIIKLKNHPKDSSYQVVEIKGGVLIVMEIINGVPIRMDNATEDEIDNDTFDNKQF